MTMQPLLNLPNASARIMRLENAFRAENDVPRLLLRSQMDYFRRFVIREFNKEVSMRWLLFLAEEEAK